MLLLLFLFQIIYSNEPIKFYEQEENIGIERFAYGKNNVVVSYGRESNFSPTPTICISKDGGRNFDIIDYFNFRANNRTLSQIEFNDDKFIIHQQYGHIYRYSTDGIFIDSLKLDTEYSHSVKSVKSDKYLVNLYQRENYDLNYKIFITNNAYDTYKTIDLEYSIDSLTSRWINDIDIFDEYLFISYLRYYKVYENNDSADYCVSKVFRYNLNNYEIDSFYINDAHFRDFSINKIKAIDENSFLLINTVSELIPNSTYIIKNSLYLYNENELIFLDSIKGPLRNEYIEFNKANDSIFYINNDVSNFYKINPFVRNSESLHLNLIDYFPINSYPRNQIRVFKKNEESNTYFANFGLFLMIEFDLDFLFLANSIEKIEDNSRIFPNPAPKGQTVSIELNEFAENIIIYDLLGNKIMKINQFSNKYEIPTANISPGVYIAIIETSGKRKITKFIVE